MQGSGSLALGMHLKLSERVADQLHERNQKGEFAPVAQLLTENALVELFDVSRTVVRDAISSLRADGLMKAHQARGVFVCEASRSGAASAAGAGMRYHLRRGLQTYVSATDA